jgi:L-seryl-tRNA(Ser) seleniumtransferase
VRQVPGITTSVSQPNGLSNRTPSLRVLWDAQRFGLTGDGVSRTLFDTEPRIAMSATRNGALVGVSVTPYMMVPGDEKIIAERLYAILSRGQSAKPTAPPSVPVSDLTGRWDVRIEYAAGRSVHTLHLRQRANEIDGSHQGEFITRDVAGTIDGDTVQLRSAFGEAHGDAITFVFTGKVAGNEMSGALDMGEYLGAKWAATRGGRA